MFPTLKLGDSGDAVKKLQQKLALLGWLKPDAAIDGEFGPKTEAAVKAFQFKSGLKPDGVYGPKSDARLNENAIAKTVDAGGPPSTDFVDGWYKDARRCPLHHGRIGAEIKPKGAVFHTTDTLGGMAGMLQRWNENRGDGGGAHFMIGRRAPTASELLDEQWPTAGVVQMVPINRNGNHAGGPAGKHGRVIMPGQSRNAGHPNSHYVGIEVVAGGRLQRNGDVFRHPDGGKPVPADEVFIDERGKPWHLITPYQFEALGKLLDALDREMVDRFPDGSKLEPNGSYQLNAAMWGALSGVRFVGHVTLDPIRKTDPGPQGIAWLRERYGSK